MSDPYVGEIRIFAGNFAPNGWLLCQGQLVSINDYDTLFALIGTTYGGDGQNTFGLPNLASRVPVHQGTLAGGSTYPLGSSGGAEAVTLTGQTLPIHTHPVAAADSAASATAPDGAVWATWGGAEYSTAAPTTTLSPAAVSSVGGNQPHDNMSPYLAVNFIISMYGIFPSQG